MQKGTLTVAIPKAKLELSQRKRRRPTPFVRFQIGYKIEETGLADLNHYNNPEWNEDLTFRVKGQPTALLRVFDRDTESMRDYFIGETEVDLMEVYRKKYFESTYPLKKNDFSVGLVKVIMEFIPDGRSKYKQQDQSTQNSYYAQQQSYGQQSSQAGGSKEMSDANGNSFYEHDIPRFDPRINEYVPYHVLHKNAEQGSRQSQNEVQIQQNTSQYLGQSQYAVQPQIWLSQPAYYQRPSSYLSSTAQTRVYPSPSVSYLTPVNQSYVAYPVQEVLVRPLSPEVTCMPPVVTRESIYVPSTVRVSSSYTKIPVYDSMIYV